MSVIAETPQPPYYAVIFTSIRTENNAGYNKTAKKMIQLAKGQSGFLGMESAKDGISITVSYWTDLESIKQWKENVEHVEARKKGRDIWYSEFKVRIAKVERDYGMKK